MGATHPIAQTEARNVNSLNSLIKASVQGFVEVVRVLLENDRRNPITGLHYIVQEMKKLLGFSNTAQMRTLYNRHGLDPVA